MDIEERLTLVKQVGEEIVTEEELRALLESKAHPIAYDGFEPSGTAHIAQGVMRAINVNKMTQAGCRFKMFVADWHAWANNKMGGDLEKIQTTGKYLIEVWRATGMDLSKIDFVWASEFIEDEAYWKKVMNVARDTSLDRVLRTTQIMGRSEKDKLSASQILYPCMQAADIFHLQADITQLGMDQRKVNILAREVGPKLGFWKPVVVSHHMLMGLSEPPPEVPPVRLEEVRSALAQHFVYARDLMTLPGTRSALDAVERKIAHTHPVREQAESVVIREFGKYFLEAEVESDANLTEAQNQLKAAMAQSDSSVAEQSRRKALEWSAFQGLMKQGQKQVDRWLKSESVERAIAMKMSKSNPDSAVFMTDTPEQVGAKLRKAYCPEKRVRDNPILEYYRYLIFERFPSVKIERSAKYGGDLEFRSYDELRAAFEKGELHPADAKAGCAAYINRLLDPVREHFEKDAAARDLKRQVDGFTVTR